MTDPGCVVLAVEDDLNDRTLLRHAFTRAAGHVDLRMAKDAFHAEEYLVGRGEYADRTAYPLPRLILLDLKLPRRTGLSFLGWMKEQGLSSRIPVIVLSSSTEPSDIARSYALGARSYLVKSVDLAELIRVAQGIGAYASLLDSPQASSVS